MNDKKIDKLIDGINLVTTYATKFMELERVHNSSNKDVYWVIFDKDYNPYWLVLGAPRDSSPYSYDIYRVNRKKSMLDGNDKIATLDMDVVKKRSTLDYLEIVKPSLSNKKIGSALIDLFEYISFTKGAKRARGLSIAFNRSIITQKKLNAFYKHKKYNIKKLVSSTTYKLTKKFDYDTIKNYAKNFITIKENNIIFKVQVPSGYKTIIAYKLATENKKTSLHLPITTENEKQV
ncbi:MAG: hypothetical protein CVV59_01060 [Tenericutes bacterium HGW-Tenericutes-4]|nr:MAG: hypothetical protein CVV59_01060 [Tenericutes bacterium HGW-Tenericutes-4]